MPKKLLVNSSPHYRSSDTTANIMGRVIIALIPILGISVVFFGFRALTITLVSVGACITFETLFNYIVKKKNTAFDFSCVVTGMLLAFNLPVTVPYWMVVIGAAFAIIIVKMLFGGIGKNFLNPALAARTFLFSWPTLMTTFIKPFSDLPIFSDPMFTNSPILPENIDVITSATPLKALKMGMLPTSSISDMLIGNIGGCIGETSALIIILGGCYLLANKIITWHIPVSYVGTVAVLSFIFPRINGLNLQSMLSEILSGGLLLGAIFMATDYSTSPITKKGKLIYGIGCGILTIFLRYFSGYPEAVSYSILLMNIFAFSIDKFMKSRRYGLGGDVYVKQQPSK